MVKTNILFLTTEPFLEEHADELAAKMKPEGIFPMPFEQALGFLKSRKDLRCIALLKPAEGETKMTEFRTQIRAIDAKIPIVVIVTSEADLNTLKDMADTERVKSLIDLIKTTVGAAARYKAAN